MDIIEDEIINNISGFQTFWVEGPKSLANNLTPRVRVGFAPSSIEVKGTFFISPGRIEFIEKYADPILKLTSLGFNVLIIDHRGQGLSDRLSDNPFIGHMDDFNLAVTHFENAIEASKDKIKGPLFLLCHSMGGSIGLGLLIKNQSLFSGAVFSSPMWGLDPIPFAKEIAALGVALGLSEKTAIGVRKVWRPLEFATNDVTHNPKELARTNSLFLKDKRLQIGGASYGWINEAFKFMAGFTKQALSEIKVPILLQIAGEEKVVDTKKHLELKEYFPNIETYVISGAYHEILQETPVRQKEFWDNTEKWLSNIL